MLWSVYWGGLSRGGEFGDGGGSKNRYRRGEDKEMEDDTGFHPESAGWSGSSDGFFPPQERNDKKHEEQEKAYFGDASGSSRESAKAKHTSNESHDNKSKSPGEHRNRVVWVG